MKVSYLIELLKNTNITYKSTSDVSCYDLEDLYLRATKEDGIREVISFKSKEYLNKYKEIQNKEIGEINSFLSYSYDSKGIDMNVYDCDYTDNTLGNLFSILKVTKILDEIINNKWIEVVVSSSKGLENYYFNGIEMDLFNKPNPWGWDQLKNMTVKEIKEINNVKTCLMKIVVSDE